jgi:hypothetical protein
MSLGSAVVSCRVTQLTSTDGDMPERAVMIKQRSAKRRATSYKQYKSTAEDYRNHKQ